MGSRAGGGLFRIGLRIAVLAVGIGVPAMAQSNSVRFGDVEVTTEGREIRIRRGESIWQVDVSRQIRTNDCALSYDAAGKSICPTLPLAPCPKCVRSVQPFGWDPSRQNLYFAIGTDVSQNGPWTLFRYSLRSRRIARLPNTRAAALADGVVSPSGRYLAYIVHWHSVCSGRDDVELVDLWYHRTARMERDPDGDDDLVTLGRIRWRSDSKLQYSGSLRSKAACRGDAAPSSPRLTEGSVSIGALQFR